MESNSPVKYALDAGLTTRQQISADTPVLNLQLLDDDGNPIRFPSGGGTQLQAATKTTLGGIKMGNAVADTAGSAIGTLATLDSGATVGVDQYNQLVTAINQLIDRTNAIQTTQDELLANLRGCGVIDASA